MTNDDQLDSWLWADWPALKHVRAGTTTRRGGISSTPFNELNLAEHVGDDEESVNKNREQIIKHLSLKSMPNWLNQSHSSNVITLNEALNDNNADAAITNKQNQVCAILTADCVPVLFCNADGSMVAAAHAGWKGICHGVIENTIKQFPASDSLLAWIGPCICSHHYEVGEDVRSACLAHASFLAPAFKPNANQHWQCNLAQMIKLILNNAGVNKIYDSGLCTFKQDNLFYSYRRDGKTGRTAAMIWME